MEAITVYIHFHMQKTKGSHPGKETCIPGALRMTKSISVSLEMTHLE